MCIFHAGMAGARRSGEKGWSRRAGVWWIPVDTGGYRWIPVDTGGYQWIPVGTSGYWRIPMDTSGFWSQAPGAMGATGSDQERLASDRRARDRERCVQFPSDL